MVGWRIGWSEVRHEEGTPTSRLLDNSLSDQGLQQSGGSAGVKETYFRDGAKAKLRGKVMKSQGWLQA